MILSVALENSSRRVSNTYGYWKKQKRHRAHTHIFYGHKSVISLHHIFARWRPYLIHQRAIDAVFTLIWIYFESKLAHFALSKCTITFLIGTLFFPRVMLKSSSILLLDLLLPCKMIFGAEDVSSSCCHFANKNRSWENKNRLDLPTEETCWKTKSISVSHENMPSCRKLLNSKFWQANWQISLLAMRSRFCSSVCSWLVFHIITQAKNHH